MLRDYLYIDQIRLDSYISQLLGSTETFDKTKKLTAEFAITGPKAQFTQDQRFRDLTIEEKMASLEARLRTESRLSEQRPSEKWVDYEFVLEKFVGFRVIVAENVEAGQNSPAFAFWLSLESDNQGLLCLLENCRSDDSPPYSYKMASTYTVLQSLVHFTRSQIRKSILARVIPDDFNPNPYVKTDDTHPPSLVEEFHNVKKSLNEFVKDPLTLLQKWGCIISSPRTVVCLYRVREYGPETANDFNKVTTFAYPVYIYTENL
jgi:hypothetical protein